MQDVWWYLVGDSPQGPVSSERLEAMLHADEMTPQSLVWKEGLTEWICISQLPGLLSVPAAAARRDPWAGLPLAGAWRRCVARILDLWLVAMPTWMLMAAALAHFWPEIMARSYAMCALALVQLPLVLLAEAGIYGCLGNTPGKALLRIMVTNCDGSCPSAAQYLRRQAGVYWYGLGMGLPIIGLIAMAAQGLNLRNGDPTAYDAGRFLVRVRK